MDIHKPKPVHGWRDFVKEIGSIIIGVSIALAAEQGVEWWRWQHELRETRQALQSELPRLIGILQYNIAMQNCSDRRLDELTRWLDHSKPSDQPPMLQPVGQPAWYTLPFGAWEVAKSGQAAWRMPLEEKLHYTRLYGQLSQFLERIQENNRIWEQLTQFTSAEPLDHADRVRLRGLIASGKTAATVVRSYTRAVMPEVRALGITPRKMPDIPRGVSFCKPLFAR